MKSNQVNKLYAKLTPHEQAGLVMEAAARLDENTADAILAQVERRHYIATHADYTRRIHALTALTGQYGIEYWKIRALMLLSVSKAEDGHTEVEPSALQFLAKAVALESAIIEICKQLKVDVAAIKSMASCPDADAEPKDLPDVDKVQYGQYMELFSGLIT